MRDPVDLELEFLRYFYEAAGHVFGPADADVYQCIKEEFVAQGGILPKEYSHDE